MKWMEAIKAQTAKGLENKTKIELTELISDFLNNSNSIDLIEAGLYTHASVSGCFSVYLTWDTKRPIILGSPLGVQLTQALKSFGLVDHSVWICKREK
ncbi:MAG: hypothetical protein K8S18_03830 [Desulfobacula sp.]|nr:hypothetical protein [Desulfobacula sp.]